MDPILDKLVLNNPIREWLAAIGLIAAAIIVLRLVQSVVISRIKKLTQTTKSSFDDFIIAVLQSSVMPLLYFLSIYVGLQYLQLSSKTGVVLRAVMMVIVTFYILKILNAFVKYMFRQALMRQEGNAQRQKQAKGILLIMQVLIWALGLLFLIDNLGYDITTLVAGLGIGGIAIALAAQTILGDLFSYLVIFFDKPFEIGDFIIVDDKLGSVEYIGIKTTHIRTLGGEQLVMSNTDLTNSRVHNYKRMQERRVVFSFNVSYETPREKLKMISQWVRRIIEATDNTRVDRAHFLSFGDWSLKFEVVYYVLSPDYNIYMDIQQHINLQIMEMFEKEKVNFAIPANTVFVRNTENKNGVEAQTEHAHSGGAR